MNTNTDHSINQFMRYLLIFFSLAMICCKPSPKTESKVISSDSITDLRIDSILNSHHIEGAVLVYDPSSLTYYCNNYEWAKTKRLPASTFKIVNSIIGLETGVIMEDSIQFKWDGEKRRMQQWEQDMDVKLAYRLSCVPCYQQVARSIGLERMNAMLTKFEYGNMTIDSPMLDIFWLEGDFAVSCFDQINFLKRLHNREMDIAESSYESMERIMRLDSNDEYTLYGKTGWAIRNGTNNGWFVGFVKTARNTYYFATNINPTAEFNMELFPAIRPQVSLEVLRSLELIH